MELKRNDTKLRQEIFDQTLKTNELQSLLENEKHKVQEIEMIKKKYQQSEEVSKKKIEEMSLKLSSLSAELDDKVGIINELQSKLTQDKERSCVRVKKLEEDVKRFK